MSDRAIETKLARPLPPKGKILLQHYTCPVHDIHALMLMSPDGKLTRLTGTKCCGTWTWVQDFVLASTTELEREIAAVPGDVSDAQDAEIARQQRLLTQIAGIAKS